MKTWQKIGLLLTLIVCVLIVGHMEYEQELQEEAWVKSVQALEMEQQKIQLDILEVREQILKADEQIRAHNLLIDLELELEGER